MHNCWLLLALNPSRLLKMHPDLASSRYSGFSPVLFFFLLRVEKGSLALSVASDRVPDVAIWVDLFNVVGSSNKAGANYLSNHTHIIDTDVPALPPLSFIAC